MRAVFDTGAVLSALLYSRGQLAWLRAHWCGDGCVPLIASATVDELVRVLAYPKFALSADEQHELLGDYLPYAQTVARLRSCPVICRDAGDQPFLDLAHTGRAAVLVSGDADLLSLAGQTAFAIESPAAYRQRVLRR